MNIFLTCHCHKTNRVEAAGLKHTCYKTDFLFAKIRGPNTYFMYTFLSTQWTFCASMRKNCGAFVFVFVFVCLFVCLVFFFFGLFKFLENACFVCISMGNGPLSPFFEAFKGLFFKNAPYYFFLIFAEKVTLLYRDIIMLIPWGASTSKYRKSAFSM